MTFTCLKFSLCTLPDFSLEKAKEFWSMLKNPYALEYIPGFLTYKFIYP